MLGRYPIGVMQGRLLPKYNGRYQAHPKGYWQDEFGLCKQLGVELIEFILDYEDAWENPLLSSEGLVEIKNAISGSGVSVKTICADYFMEAPLHSESPAVVEQSSKVLDVLIENASQLGVSDIVIPCVDQSTLSDSASQTRFVDQLKPFLERADSCGVNFSLETDLAPEPFARLLEAFDFSPRIKVNYDIGNSAALGYDPAEEFSCYGKHISDIHIKDRLRGEGSVELGSGHADFDKVFSLICGSGYQGPLIMQVYRDDEGVEVFKSQLNWLQERFSS